MALKGVFRKPQTTLQRMLIAALVFALGFVVFATYTRDGIKPQPVRETQTPMLSRFLRGMLKEPPHSSHRWRTIFQNIFDKPNPLSFRIGPDNVKFKNKYVIYRCDNDTMAHCGGWANRAKGVITAYLLANLTGRVFKSEILMPECDIQQFLIPNHVNWSLPISFHKKIKPNKKVKILDMFGKPEFYYNFSQTDWIHNPVMNSDIVYTKCNFDLLDNFKESKFHAKKFQWMQGQDRVALNRFLFTRLFKPTSYLRNKVINFLTEHVGAEEKLLCIHLRMGNNPTIPKENRKSVNFDYLSNVWNSVKQVSLPRLGDNVKIFLMSDSNKAIAKAREQDFGNRIFLSPGEIIHIELSENVTNKQMCDGLEKVLFEQLVLLHCDSIILSDSGISRMSAYIRGRDDELYCFLKHGPVVPCKLIDLKTEIYHTRG